MRNEKSSNPAPKPQTPRPTNPAPGTKSFPGHTNPPPPPPPSPK